MSNDVNKAFNDSVSLIATDYHERTILFNSKKIESLDFERMQRIYTDRFVDASDFTFVFVGNIDAEQVKPLVQKYIGSIASINREETWKDTEVNYPKAFTNVPSICADDKSSTPYSELPPSL